MRCAAATVNWEFSRLRWVNRRSLIPRSYHLATEWSIVTPQRPDTGTSAVGPSGLIVFFDVSDFFECLSARSARLGGQRASLKRGMLAVVDRARGRNGHSRHIVLKKIAKSPAMDQSSLFRRQKSTVKPVKVWKITISSRIPMTYRYI